MAIRARRGRSDRPGIEILEGRTLLNASIDIAADGVVVYKTDPAAAQSLLLTTAGGVYTFAVDPGGPAIDVTSNAAGLVVAGSGSTTVTVAGPSRLWIEAASDGQAIEVRGTAVPMRIALEADGATVFLGDAGAGGLGSLAGPVAVVAASGTTSNGLTVSDGARSYDPAGVLKYILSATTVTAEGVSGFAGVSYSGLASLRLNGTTNRTAPVALYLTTGTADGTSTTIDGTDGFARDFSIVGMSSDPSSRLTLLAAGVANVWASYIGSPTVFSGGSLSTIWIEAVRDEEYGLHSTFLVDAAAKGVWVNVGPYWRGGPAGPAESWELLSGTVGPNPFVRLRDDFSPAGAGLLFRPDQMESLVVDARGAESGSMLVDFRNGDPLPSASPYSRLTYSGAPRAISGPGLGYAMGLTGTPPEGPFAEEMHLAFPRQRGAIELTKADGSKRRVAYQLSESADWFDDGLGVTSYAWMDELFIQDEKDDYSNLMVDLAWSMTGGGVRALGLHESNARFGMATLSVARKTQVRILRGWAASETATTLDYAYYVSPSDPPPGIGVPDPPAGLERLVIDGEGLSRSPIVRVYGAPRGVATTVRQPQGGVMVLRPIGVAMAKSVVLDGGGLAILGIDSTGVRLTDADFSDLGEGWVRIRPAPGGSALIAFNNYRDVRIYNAPVAAG